MNEQDGDVKLKSENEDEDKGEDAVEVGGKFVFHIPSPDGLAIYTLTRPPSPNSCTPTSCTSNKRSPTTTTNTQKNYAIQNHTRSAQFLATRSGHCTASNAALPVVISASAALTGRVRLNSFQNRYRPK